MFKAIDKLSYTDAAEVVYYAVSEIRNPHIDGKNAKLQISDSNRKIARGIIREVSSSIGDAPPDIYIDRLYNKLVEKAEDQKMPDNSRGMAILDKFYDMSKQMQTIINDTNCAEVRNSKCNTVSVKPAGIRGVSVKQEDNKNARPVLKRRFGRKAGRGTICEGRTVRNRLR